MFNHTNGRHSLHLDDFDGEIQAAERQDGERDCEQ